MTRLGIDVIITPALPTYPSVAEDARRMIRHGYGEEFLAWCGAGPVGPAPGEPTHVMLAMDPGAKGRGAPILFASREAHERIKRGELVA